jgi:hypothetical protein
MTILYQNLLDLPHLKDKINLVSRERGGNKPIEPPATFFLGKKVPKLETIWV